MFLLYKNYVLHALYSYINNIVFHGNQVRVNDS